MTLGDVLDIVGSSYSWCRIFAVDNERHIKQ